jgi:hypothetical protein
MWRFRKVSGSLWETPGITQLLPPKPLGAAHANGPVEFPSLAQAHPVCAAIVVHVGKLDGIVLPPAYFTDEPRAGWRFIQRQVAATRTRESLMIQHASKS